MTAFNRFATVLGFALISVQAQAVDFSFTSGTVSAAALGNSYTASAGGVTLAASAWSSTGRAGQFQTAALTLTPGAGMGACNRIEGVDCSASNFDGALGNNTDRNNSNTTASDLILFSFSSAVNLRSLTLRQYGGDSDLSLWAGTGTFSPAGLKARLLEGTATSYNNTSNVNTIKSVSLAAYTGSYDWLAIAASVTNPDRFADLARLQSLTINPVAQPVPEAATWMTMLAGLGLVGFRVSRRMQT